MIVVVLVVTSMPTFLDVRLWVSEFHPRSPPSSSVRVPSLPRTSPKPELRTEWGKKKKKKTKTLTNASNTWSQLTRINITEEHRRRRIKLCQVSSLSTWRSTGRTLNDRQKFHTSSVPFAVISIFNSSWSFVLERIFFFFLFWHWKSARPTAYLATRIQIVRSGANPSKASQSKPASSNRISLAWLSSHDVMVALQLWRSCWL